MAAKQAPRCVRYHAARPSRPLTAPTRCRTPCGSGLCPRMSRRGGSGTTRRALRGQSPLPQLGRHSPQVRQFFLWERAEPAPTIGAIFPQVGQFFLWEWAEPAPTIRAIFPQSVSFFCGSGQSLLPQLGRYFPRWVSFFCGSGQSPLPQLGRYFPQVGPFFLWEWAEPAPTIGAIFPPGGSVFSVGVGSAREWAAAVYRAPHSAPSSAGDHVAENHDQFSCSRARSRNA